MYIKWRTLYLNLIWHTWYAECVSICMYSTYMYMHWMCKRIIASTTAIGKMLKIAFELSLNYHLSLTSPASHNDSTVVVVIVVVVVVGSGDNCRCRKSSTIMNLLCLGIFEKLLMEGEYTISSGFFFVFFS